MNVRISFKAKVSHKSVMAGYRYFNFDLNFYLYFYTNIMMYDIVLYWYVTL